MKSFAPRGLCLGHNLYYSFRNLYVRKPLGADRPVMWTGRRSASALSHGVFLCKAVNAKNSDQDPAKCQIISSRTKE